MCGAKRTHCRIGLPAVGGETLWDYICVNRARLVQRDVVSVGCLLTFSTTCKVFVGWLVGCLTSQKYASVSQKRSCSDNFSCCHTKIEVADQTCYLTQSQYTDTGPTSPNADPIMPGAWQGSHWSANFEVTGMTRPRKNPIASRIRAPYLLLPRLTT